ncbi:MAG: SAM-dependent methyltransferase [Anaerolineae bacterium]|nr:methyltransferase domain-containing protein [Anaerolineae bacterium]MCQ3976965.1 SAM-dependent methyltransferase [Anaerolineae bacterium]
MTTTTTGHALSTASWLDTHYLACQAEYEAMLSAVGLQAGWHVLDAGCGSGSFLPLMANLLGPSGHITAIDLTPENVATVEVLVKSDHFPCRVELRLGSVAEMPDEDATFDAVWNANVSQYLTDDELPAMLAEFRRAVKPGGLVAVKESDITALQFRPAPANLLWHLFEALVSCGNIQVIGSLRAIELPAWFRRAGLRDIRCKTTLVERYTPLRPVEREFFGSLLAWLANQAERRVLPPDEKKCWQELGEVDSPQHILNAADFYWREAHVLVVGRVP